MDKVYTIIIAIIVFINCILYMHIQVQLREVRSIINRLELDTQREIRDAISAYDSKIKKGEIDDDI